VQEYAGKAKDATIQGASWVKDKASEVVDNIPGDSVTEKA
jgi:hypothetical protein